MKRWHDKLFRKFLFVLTAGLLGTLVAIPAGAAGEQQTIAVNFLKFLRSDKTIRSSERIEGSRLDPALPPVTVADLFHLDGGGYLLVSTDRTISPVKAYSLAGDFANLPPSYRRALLAELELRVRVAPAGAVRAPLDAERSETEKQWDFLLRLDQLRLPLAYTDGTALLKTQWNQGYPYNKFLPAVDGETVVAGCVNVAVAQLMRYHRFPASGKGVVSYEWTPTPPPSPLPPWPSQTLKAILERPLNWERMPDRVDAVTPGYEADEVALLIRDLGIANRTAFDADGSSTHLHSDVLTKNYGYSTALGSIDNAAFLPFLERLQAEILEERPVLLTFPGHMTVADGYVTDGTGTKVHVNMGWGGSADDFYFLNQPVAAGGYTFPVDAGSLEIHYNIKPCSSAAGDCHVNLEAGDGTSGLAIAGRFDRDGDADLYELYLQGPTTLSATRGYSNIAFYVSVTNLADGAEVLPAPDPDAAAGTVFSAGSLTAGRYAVRVSLCDDAGTFCYSADAKNLYTVTLTSGAVTESERVLIDQALDRPPVIGSPFPDLILRTNSGVRRILVDARDENGDPLSLTATSSNPVAVAASLSGNLLELTPTGVAKVSARITVAAEANGKRTEKSFTAMTDDVETAFGKSFTIAGIFTSSEEIATHQAILAGACTVQGNRSGYGNQAFFSSVVDATGGVVAAADGYLSSEIRVPDRPAAVYSLKAALCESGGCYPFTTGDAYALIVGCPDAEDSTTAIAGLLGISLAGANLPIVWSGDVDGDGRMTLADAILAMQLLSGIDVGAKTVRLAADVNGDGRIGPAEALFVLQAAAGLRPR